MGISREQALDCLASDDLIGIGMEADAVRRRLHPEGVVSYGMEQVLLLGCRNDDEILEQAERAVEMGATGLLLTGRVVGGLERLAQGIGAVRKRFAELWLQGFTVRQLTELTAESERELGEVLERLRDAGLNSIGAATAEVADETWSAVHRAAHEAGMRTAARLIFGGEPMVARLDGLDRVRQLQEETGGFAAVAPVSFHAEGGRELDETTAVEYLKTLAVTRIYVDNVENLEADWTTQGLKVLQMGLRFGANDAGAVQVECRKGATEEEVRRVIRDAGFRPAQRELGYRAMMVG